MAKCLLSAVFVARLVTPTEGAGIGETIWIAQLALLALLAWAFGCYQERKLALPSESIDIAAGLLVGGHILSALLIVLGTGDKRSALTMLWEWVGVGATYFLIRQGAGSVQFRRDMLSLVMAIAVPLAVVGLHQYFLGYADVQRQYGSVKSRWDELQQRLPQLTAHDAAIEEAQVEREFARLGVPLTEGARVMWEQRIFESREPFGMFALANTFAGVLGVALVLWIGATADRFQFRQVRWPLVFAELSCVLVGYCLVLTKSRTAYVAMTVALPLWMLLSYGWARITRIRKLWLVVGAVILAVFMVVGWETEIFDQLLFIEAGKSLKYRSEYWAGTWHMLCAGTGNLLFGVGPGNFRQHYLRHKLPESSEEIADPHNMLLDVWSSGGLVALAGLILICVIIGRRLFPCATAKTDDSGGSMPAPPLGSGKPDGGRATHFQQNSESMRKESANQFQAPGVWLLVGGAGGVVSVFGSSGWQDDRLLLLLCGWLVVLFIMAIRSREDVLIRLAPAIAFVFLAVHLLGAGGIGMPAISQLFLMLPAVGTAAYSPSMARTRLNSRVRIVGVGTALLGVYVACWTTGMSPVLNRRAFVVAGDDALNARNPDPERSEASYRKAAEFDSLSPEPYEKLGAIYYAHWQARPGDRMYFDRAVQSYEQAAARNPHSFAQYRALGELYFERFARSKDRADARHAAEFFSQAVERYPNHAELQARHALALAHAARSSEARTAAERALALHKSNLKARHLDKFLSQATVAQLQEIVSHGNLK